MNIAYIVSSLRNAGPINVVADLVKVFMANGHKCKVFYFSDAKGQDFPCETERISLYSNIKWNEFDVVHTHGGRPDLYVMLRKPLRTKTRTLSTIHSFIFEDHRYKYGRFLSIFTTRTILSLTKRHDKVVVLSKTAIEYYRRFFKADKLCYAYNTRFSTQEIADDGDAYKIREFGSNFSTIIGSICSISERKGLDQIIRALPKLSHVGYIIVGDGIIMNDLKTLAKKLNVSDQVLFLGRRNHGNRYLEFIDFLVMPSRSEGFPLAMLEAASVGKPVISSNLPVFNELFRPEELPRFELENIESLVEVINQSIPLKDVLGKNIKNRYDKDYSPENFYQTHLKLYTD